MKKNNKEILAIVAFVLAAAALFMLLREGVTAKFPKVAQDSNFAANDAYLYYNDENNDIYRLHIDQEKAEKFAENCTVMSAYKDEILAMQEGMLIVLDKTGQPAETIGKYNTNNACITDKYVYYKDSDTKRLNRIIRENGENEIVPMMENIKVDKFLADAGGDLYFTADGDKVVRYNPETMVMGTYAEGTKVVDFSVDDGYLIYSNGNSGYKVFCRRLDNSEDEQLKNVETKKLYYKNGRVFYIDNVGKNRKSYNLLINYKYVHNK